MESQKEYFYMLVFHPFIIQNKNTFHRKIFPLAARAVFVMSIFISFDLKTVILGLNWQTNYPEHGKSKNYFTDFTSFFCYTKQKTILKKFALLTTRAVFVSTIDDGLGLFFCFLSFFSYRSSTSTSIVDVVNPTALLVVSTCP